jgi:hypothetical protein
VTKPDQKPFKTIRRRRSPDNMGVRTFFQGRAKFSSGGGGQKHIIFFQKSRKTYYLGRPGGRGGRRASAPSCPALCTLIPGKFYVSLRLGKRQKPGNVTKNAFNNGFFAQVTKFKLTFHI